MYRHHILYSLHGVSGSYLFAKAMASNLEAQAMIRTEVPHRAKSAVTGAHSTCGSDRARTSDGALKHLESSQLVR